MSIDTGDNMALSLDRQAKQRALYVACQFLEIHGWRPLRTYADSFGRYCVIMERTEQPHRSIAVVAKGSRIWKGILSTQTKLVKLLARRSQPLVIHIEGHGFYVFNALDLLLNGEKANIRFQVEMWNFKRELGCYWDGDADTYEGPFLWFQRKEKEAEQQLEALKKFEDSAEVNT